MIASVSFEILSAERKGNVVAHGGLVRGERGRRYFGVAVSQDEQRDDPEHGEQHLPQMRIRRDTYDGYDDEADTLRRENKRKKKKHRENEENRD